MGLVLIAPPAVEPITLTEAKAHLRVDFSDDDALIAGLIAAAREYCEGFQNRAYVTQTWQLWLDAWPAKDRITIPRPPLQSVASVKYYGADNAEHILPETDYYVDDKSEPGRLVLAYGKSWPTAVLRPANAVCIEFVAGYGDNAGKVPQKVKDAMVIHMKLFYDDYKPEERRKMEEARDRLLWQDRMVPV